MHRGWMFYFHQINHVYYLIFISRANIVLRFTELWSITVYMSSFSYDVKVFWRVVRLVMKCLCGFQGETWNCLASSCHLKLDEKLMKLFLTWKYFYFNKFKLILTIHSAFAVKRYNFHQIRFNFWIFLLKLWQNLSSREILGLEARFLRIFKSTRIFTIPQLSGTLSTF